MRYILSAHRIRFVCVFSVADIAYPLHDTVGVLPTGIGFPIGCECQTGTAVAAEDIPGQQGPAPNVQRNGTFCLGGIGAGCTNPLRCLKHLRCDDL